MRTRLTAALLSSALLLAACGGDDDEAAAPVAGSGEGGGATTATVAYLPLVATATAFRADSEGLFDEEGLDVTLEQVPGGAQAIPSLVSGDFDLIYSNYVSLIVAASQGLPLQVVAGNDVGADDHGIFVAAGSDITDVADLAGKRVAVNALNNLGTVLIKNIVDDAGGDADSIQFLELPFPDMGAALDRGDIDAMWQVEPFQARALAAGATKLVDLFSGPNEGLPVAGWATTREYADGNADAIEAFRTGLAGSTAALNEDPALLQEVVPTYSMVEAAVVAQISPPQFEAEADPEVLQRLADLMLQFGVLTEEYDVTELVAP